MTKTEKATQEVNDIVLSKFEFISKIDFMNLNPESLLSDFGIDSIDCMDLELEFEMRLDCIINEDIRYKTYGDLINVYEKYMIDE